MANTYTHRVVSLKKSNGIYLNIVNSIVVEVTVSDGTNSLSHNYTIGLSDPVDDGNNNSFIEYNSLTEAQLISWLTSNDIEYEQVKVDIDRKLKESLQDDVESNFPWS
mgnify:CR=1 FL=1